MATDEARHNDTPLQPWGAPQPEGATTDEPSRKAGTEARAWTWAAMIAGNILLWSIILGLAGRWMGWRL